MEGRRGTGRGIETAQEAAIPLALQSARSCDVSVEELSGGKACARGRGGGVIRERGGGRRPRG